MDKFWISPPPPNDPRRTTRAWDAIVAHMQPPERRTVMPLQRARIVVATSVGADIVSAIWGLVPAWATSKERRPLALRHARLDAELVPESTVTGDIWSRERPSSRCLVPVSGWIAECRTGSKMAFAPEDGVVTVAGLQNTIAIDGGDPVNTFGIFYRVCALTPYDGSCVPVVIRAEDRQRWLSSRPYEAKGLLKIPGMKVHVRRLRDDHRADIAIYGSVQPED